jgi:hypothetical protein
VGKFIRIFFLSLGAIVALLIIGFIILSTNETAQRWVFQKTQTMLARPYFLAIPPELKLQLLDYLEAYGEDPPEYVVGKFDEYDVVFLGEYHRIRHNPLFVAELVPKLYEAGVTNLGVEFACTIDQGRIDSLLSYTEYYNEDLARDIQWRFRGGWWPYKEYLEIYRSVWEVNSSQSPGEEPFRILALSPAINYDKLLRGTAEENEEERRASVGVYDTTMALVIKEEVLDNSEKALVYCGMHHSFTKYRQPVVSGGEFIRLGEARAGNILVRDYDARAATIFLHGFWSSNDEKDFPFFYLPFMGFIDQVYTEYDRPVGFDIVGTPFGELEAPGSYYAAGREFFQAKDIYDGYVILKNLSEFTATTVDRNWIRSERDLALLNRSTRRELNLESEQDFFDLVGPLDGIEEIVDVLVPILEDVSRQQPDREQVE